MDEVELERETETVEDVIAVCDAPLSDGTVEDVFEESPADDIEDMVPGSADVLVMLNKALLDDGDEEMKVAPMEEEMLAIREDVLVGLELDVAITISEDEVDDGRFALNESPVVEEFKSIVDELPRELVELNTALVNDGDEETRLLAVEEVLSMVDAGNEPLVEALDENKGTKVEDWLDTALLWLDVLDCAEELEVVTEVEVEVEEGPGMALLTLDVLVFSMELLEMPMFEDDELIATELLMLDVLDTKEVLLDVEDRVFAGELVVLA